MRNGKISIVSVVCMLILASCTVGNDDYTNILSFEPAQAVTALGAGPREPISPGNVFAPSTGLEYERQGSVTIDTSNVSRGYIMIRYEGTADRAVARVEKPGADHPYDFNLTKGGQWDVVTMTRGNGTYRITVLENVQDRMFTTVLTTSVDVTLKDPLLPFLYPNRFVNFNANSRAVALAEELAKSAENDLEVVRRIYEYIISNIKYDHDLAEMITADMVTSYIPDVDRTLRTGRGICFDYAALMTAMLRAQHIPARLEIGFVSETVFHAWVSVYIGDAGWINSVQFDGSGWSRLDPTFSANIAELGGLMDGESSYNMIFAH